MIVQFNGIGHPHEAAWVPLLPWERLVDGGLTGFRLARHEAWRRNDRDGDDAFPVARDMAQQNAQACTRRGKADALIQDRLDTPLESGPGTDCLAVRE